MKFISRTSAYNKNIHRVRLEPHEMAYSDYRIVTLVDNNGELTDDQWASIEKGEKHPGHFGGEVRAFANGELEVTVYTD